MGKEYHGRLKSGTIQGKISAGGGNDLQVLIRDDHDHHEKGGLQGSIGENNI